MATSLPSSPGKNLCRHCCLSSVNWSTNLVLWGCFCISVGGGCCCISGAGLCFLCVLCSFCWKEDFSVYCDGTLHSSCKPFSLESLNFLYNFSANFCGLITEIRCFLFLFPCDFSFLLKKRKKKKKRLVVYLCLKFILQSGFLLFLGCLINFGLWYLSFTLAFNGNGLLVFYPM